MNHKYRSMSMCGYVHLTEKWVDAKALESKMETHEHMDDFKKKWGRSIVNKITQGCGETNMETWLLHIKWVFVKLLLCPEITFNKMWYSGQIKQLPLETLLCSFLDMLWINNKPIALHAERSKAENASMRKSWHPAFQCFLRPLSDKHVQDSSGM